jgi:glutamyl/glutaminyl-tRNA synthetase
MVNFLAFLGWNPGGDTEIMTPEEIIGSFSLERIHKSGAMLNEEKLLWMNKEHMRRQPREKQMESVKQYLKDYPDDLLERLLPSVIERINVYGELPSIEAEEFRFLVSRPDVPKEKVQWKNSDLSAAREHLCKVRDIVGTADFSSSESVKQAIMPYAEEKGKGDVLWPFRMALSGQEKSIDPFTIAYLLGKEETLARLDAICHKLEG